MENFGKTLVVVGLGIAITGALMWLLKDRLGGGTWLPGDISVKGDRFSFHFPIVTCLVISLVLTLISRFFGK